MNNSGITMQVPYFQIPNDIFEIGLEKHELLIYMYLARCGNQGNKSFPSYNTIAKKTGISRRKVIDCVKALEDKRLLVKETRYNYEQGEHYSNVYRVVHDVKDTPSAHHALGSAGHAPRSAGHAPYKELEYKELDNKELIHLPEEDDFIFFYLKTFKEYMGKDHMKVQTCDFYRIQDAIDELKSNDISLEEWEEAVEEHFANLPKSNNGNILAFIKATKRYFDVEVEVC